ncbi:hypothetical protein D3C73_926030 [compost metagenome]
MQLINHSIGRMRQSRGHIPVPAFRVSVLQIHNGRAYTVGRHRLGVRICGFIKRAVFKYGTIHVIHAFQIFMETGLPDPPLLTLHVHDPAAVPITGNRAFYIVTVRLIQHQRHGKRCWRPYFEHHAVGCIAQPQILTFIHLFQ